MGYKAILNNFTIDLETMPLTNVGFYDIWEIRPEIEKLEENFDKLPLPLRVEYEKKLKELKSKLDKITSFDKNDPLVKNEIVLLEKILDNHFKKYRQAS